MKIIYIRSGRRTMAIEVTKDMKVKVRLPFWVTKARADQFVKDHRAWIDKHLKQMKDRQNRYDLSDDEICFLREKASCSVYLQRNTQAIGHSGVIMKPA